MTSLVISSFLLLGWPAQQAKASDPPEPSAAAIVASVEKLDLRRDRHGRAVGGGDPSKQERKRAGNPGDPRAKAVRNLPMLVSQPDSGRRSIRPT